jgi:putative Mg2+ transporter-C (MgtC) family protein
MNAEIVMVLRLLLAAALGAIIGYQRERAHKSAGLRTHVLICIGAALFTIASIYGFGVAADPSRLAAGIVAGIGFLCAGAIIRNREHVSGLTTAATIWAVAAIGLAAGAGLYILSVVTTAVVTIVLLLPHPIR